MSMTALYLTGKEKVYISINTYSQYIENIVDLALYRGGPVKIVITYDADDDIGNMDVSIRAMFDKHILKIATKRPTRFFKDHNIERAGDQGRIIYQIDRKDDVVYILRCFATHKEYGKWCSSFRGK